MIAAFLRLFTTLNPAASKAFYTNAAYRLSSEGSDAGMKKT